MLGMPPRASVCGVPVDAVSTDDAIRTIVAWTDGVDARVAVGVNANVAYLAGRDDAFRGDVWRADLAYADGQSVVWAGRLLGAALTERLATTDLIHPLAQAMVEGKRQRLYLYGGAPGVAEAAAAELRYRYPGLETCVTHGYVHDDEAIVRSINDFAPHVLLVGLGDPLQQRWVHGHRATLSVGAILTCGGLFDWLSGNNQRAPRWMIASGLEWLWRIRLEPRRLARRYLVGNTWFLARLSADLVRGPRRAPVQQDASSGKRCATTSQGADVPSRSSR
ncbi:WecB/TagA/CpsF family glycosyltransferase [Mumia sp. zg.B21]|uniref:WecB/TagA/CpsF family glycosyltransferase n=1 Tax=Mumia sp. zg.B21 TaxID=2855447 RepID=UPI001C6F14F7|nr:WecB/TagA/CpsF family glycosyltransferase [Mumia sp. zg.B21]MBW9210763.1 WecB/TagA/CpsF family glycosyltransferase [Mumia sp. zg.B21]